ncbi:MAG: flagellar hook-associated protein FlgK [Methylocystaceae bacterium]
MRSTFFGIEMGRRAVVAQQAALDVTGHNVSNSNTTGYTRQVAEMTATDPFTYPAKTMPISAGQMGTGSVVADVRRLRDEFVDAQMLDENHRNGYWNGLQDSLSKIEGVLNEPTDTGLRGVLDEFWKSWQTLSESPESEAVRATVLENGQAVVDTIHHMYNQLTDLKNDLNNEVKVKVDDINSLGVQIKDLNIQIQSITVSGQRPNDLLDKRQVLIEELSNLVNTEVKNEANGMVTVLVGGTALVDGISSNKLAVIPDRNQMYEVVWDLPRTGNRINSTILGDVTIGDTRYPEVNLTSGELVGIINARGPAENTHLGNVNYLSAEHTGIVPGLMDNLNLVAETIVSKFNEQHKKGYALTTGEVSDINGIVTDCPTGKTGLAFFKEYPASTITDDWEWAKHIEISAEIQSNVNNIAAASKATYKEVPAGSGNYTREEFGDGGNAISLAQLKQDSSFINGTTTLDDYWRAKVSTIGVISEESQRMIENQEMLINELENKRQQVSGVSLDEEMTNMIKFQHAYNAAARFITATDEALDKIINGMGLVGR